MSYGLCIRTVEEAFRCVVASKRATRAMEDILLPKPPGPASLWSIPYRGCMDTSKEFRVLCPPVWSLYTLSRKRNPQQRGEPSPQNQADHGQEPCRVTAISQYRWLSPYHHASLTAAQEDAEKVLAGAMSIHTRIQAYVATFPHLTSVREKLSSDRFGFDIFEASNGEMQLLEIDPSGVMSGSGMIHGGRLSAFSFLGFYRGRNIED
jgi:hypothetical protein